jgi:hypothetical protein
MRPPTEHERAVRTGRRQPCAADQLVRAELAQQRADVQRVAARVGPEALDGRRGHRPARRSGRQVGDRGRVQRPQVDAALRRHDQPRQPGRHAVEALGPARQAQNHLVALHAAGREGDRIERRPIGPVHVVDHGDQRPVEGETVDDAQERRPSDQGIRARQGHEVAGRRPVERRAADELFENTVFEIRLGRIGLGHHPQRAGTRKGMAHE